MIKGLIFDFDGLILDTETPDYFAWREIYRSHNLDLKLSDWAIGVGAPFASLDLASSLEQKLGAPIDKTSIRLEHNLISSNLIQNELTLPGVEDLIRNSRGLGFKLAIASSSDDRWVTTHLKRLNLIKEFDYICTIDLVKNGKPAPDLYLFALECLGLNPEDVIAFEDSPNGIKAAKAATLFCVAVGNRMTSQMDLSQADIILQSFSNINIEQIIDLSISPK